MTMRLPRHWSGLEFEPLEQRRTPSTMGVADVASVDAAHAALSRLISTTPADGSVLDISESPSVLTLHMSRMLAVSWTNTLVGVERIESDGSQTPILNALGDADVSIDPGAGIVTISLTAPLGPGRYVFVLHPGFQSEMLSRGRWDYTKDQEIAEFEVESAAPPVQDLGVIGSAILSTSGTLANTNGAQDVYHFQLGAGQPLWQVTIQLDAQVIGSDLIAGLKVYDQSGNLVKEVLAGKFQQQDIPGGDLAAANDPYLFLGLAPGDYYVVVSKTDSQPGGDYLLNVAADPARGPTSVTSFTVDRSAGIATGFTLTFSAPLDPNTVLLDSVKAVDSNGRSYALKLTRADYGLQRVGYTFTSAVPAGDFTVVVSGERPLADMVGRTPVATGLPVGTLARFTLSTAEAPTSVPGPSPSKAIGGGTISLAGGSSVDIPIVVDQNALLTLRAQAQSGSLRIEVIGVDGTVFETTGSELLELPLGLTPGAYVVRVTAVGGPFLSGAWSLVDDALHMDVVADAVGPGGVLAIRLGVDRSAYSASQPGTPTFTPTPTPTPSFTAPIIARADAARSVEMGPSPWAAGSSAAPTLVGRPSPNGDGVASVGPTVPGSITAVAWAAPAAGWSTSPLSAILSSSTSQSDDGQERGPAGMPENLAMSADHDEKVVRVESARTDPASPDADAAALLKADRVLAALQGGFQWLFDGLGASPEPLPAGDSVAAAGPDATGPSTGQVERSSLDLPVGVLFVTASTVHLRRAALRWWRKHKAIVATSSTTAADKPALKPLFRGPRRMTPVPSRESGRVYGPKHG